MSDLFGYLGEALRGPGHLRFIVQPLLAVLLGMRDGVRDAASGKPPYGHNLLFGAGQRGQQLREGIAQILVPLCAGFIMDVCVRLYLGYGFRPLASALVGGLLVGLPYIAARGGANRLKRRMRPRRPDGRFP